MRSVNVSFVIPTGRLLLARMDNYSFGDRHRSSDPEMGYFGEVRVVMPVGQEWRA